MKERQLCSKVDVQEHEGMAVLEK